eukprot:4238672-Pleurochrysis_carterae.AAC.1
MSRNINSFNEQTGATSSAWICACTHRALKPKQGMPPPKPRGKGKGQRGCDELEAELCAGVN